MVTEHRLTVPLDHVAAQAAPPSEPAGDTIDIAFTIVDLITTPADEAFYRSLRTSPPGDTRASALHVLKREVQRRAASYVEHVAMEDADGCCLYLQGGLMSPS